MSRFGTFCQQIDAVLTPPVQTLNSPARASSSSTAADHEAWHRLSQILENVLAQDAHASVRNPLHDVISEF